MYCPWSENEHDDQICAFVFLYAKNRFSHDAAHQCLGIEEAENNDKDTEVSKTEPVKMADPDQQVHEDKLEGLNQDQVTDDDQQHTEDKQADQEPQSEEEMEVGII